jgi:PAP2 superfamily
VEPALAWDRFVTPFATEWFAFFYFGYFVLLPLHVLPMMFIAKDTARIAHFSLGIITVVVVGHVLYMLVPGWGPYHHLASQFEHPLQGGTFWHLVQATVQGGGAQKDIFPSLHTALPTYFAIFSFMHRKALPFRYTWPLLAFASSQIILATMFLRWHYLIDIFAGLALATFAALVSHRIVTWEAGHRARRGVTPIYTRLDRSDGGGREEAAP